jgi:hypothetical protein
MRMDGTPNPISVENLGAHLGTASALIVLNVRRRNPFGADDRVIVSAVARDVAAERQWLDDSWTGKPICRALSKWQRIKHRGRRAAHGPHPLKLFHTRHRRQCRQRVHRLPHAEDRGDPR